MPPLWFPLPASSAAFFSASSFLRLASSSRLMISGLVIRWKSMPTLPALSRGSRGSLRNLWLRHKDTTLPISSLVTLLRPSSATSALAARLVTRSPRRPSTFNLEQISEMSIWRSIEILTSFNLLRASISFCVRASCAGLASSARASGFASYAIRSSTSCVRMSLSMRVPTCTDRPNRSSSCGRSSPSCGLPEPIMIKRAGCTMEMPSRSTVLTPLAALSSTTSTRPSSSRFTSSTYRMPRFARASKPGS
mmetsp:Transcript_20844/g.58074  ORF Transcript_20844/g.58074 Transcript_20844/m.58074 type:complete len:250 (-) Transcript_20844:550-1299(-)